MTPSKSENINPSLPTPSSVHRRRWYQIGFRGLFLMVTVAAILMATIGLQVDRARWRRMVTKMTFDLGGQAGVEMEVGWLASLLQKVLGTENFEFAVVQSVDLRGRTLTDEQFAMLGRLRELEYLELSGSNLTTTTLSYFSKLHSLQGLDISNTAVDSIDSLKDMNNLLRLELDGLGITNQQASQVGTKRSLRHLSLEFAEITDEGLHHLSHLTDLQHLNLTGCEVTDDGLKNLSKLKNLNYLVLWNAPVSGTGFRHVPTNALTYLDLSDTLLTDEGVVEVARFTGLKKLMLNGTQLTDLGVAELKSLIQLEVLDLEGTQLTGDGLACIASMPALVELNLYNVPMSDRGLPYIQAHQGLKTLHLWNSNCTDAALAGLQHSRPGLTIEE